MTLQRCCAMPEVSSPADGDGGVESGSLGLATCRLYWVYHCPVPIFNILRVHLGLHLKFTQTFIIACSFTESLPVLYCPQCGLEIVGKKEKKLRSEFYDTE